MKYFTYQACALNQSDNVNSEIHLIFTKILNLMLLISKLIPQYLFLASSKPLLRICKSWLFWKISLQTICLLLWLISKSKEADENAWPPPFGLSSAPSLTFVFTPFLYHWSKSLFNFHKQQASFEQTPLVFIKQKKGRKPIYFSVNTMLLLPNLINWKWGPLETT